MTLRRGEPRDRSVLIAMAVRFIAESGYRGHVVPNVEQLTLLVDFLLEHGFVLVAGSSRDQVVGMLGATAITHPVSGERVGCETAWWVDPDFRGGSTSLRMLDAAEEWAAEDGCERFQMIAPAGSSIGRLYARRGYVPVETVWQRSL